MLSRHPLLVSILIYNSNLKVSLASVVSSLSDCRPMGVSEHQQIDSEFFMAFLAIRLIQEGQWSVY